MTHTLRRCSLLAAVLLLALGGSEQAAGQIQALTLEEMSRTATSIVLGTTVKHESVWDDSRTRILTEVTVRVEEHLKGEPSTETVITVPGGRLGNMIYEVSDMPVFYEGEEVLLFAWQHPTGKNLVLGGEQGKLDVVEDVATGRRTVRGGAGLLAPTELGKTGIGAAPSVAEATVDDLVSQIRAFVAE